MPSQTMPQLMAQVDRIERQVLAISEHLGIPFDSPLAGLTYGSDRDGGGGGGGGGVSPEVEQLAREGKTIYAIKLLREQSGLGLAEAKEAVERL